MTLLAQIFDDLLSFRRPRMLRVEEVELGATFVVVTLSDGTIGSSLNYPVQNGDSTFDPETEAGRCLDRRAVDPLLRSYADSHRLIDTCIATAVATALSQPLLQDCYFGPLEVRAVDSWQDHFRTLIRPRDSVCQIGFGGTADVCARREIVSRFIICDLAFSDRAEIKRARRVLRSRGLDPSVVTFETSALTSEILEEADVVCITGSALCNGSLDLMLERTRTARLVVLQGPSCSIYAPRLFRLGVSLIYGAVKSRTEWVLARGRDSRLNDAVDGCYVAIAPPGAAVINSDSSEFANLQSEPPAQPA